MDQVGQEINRREWMFDEDTAKQSTINEIAYGVVHSATERASGL